MPRAIKGQITAPIDQIVQHGLKHGYKLTVDWTIAKLANPYAHESIIMHMELARDLPLDDSNSLVPVWFKPPLNFAIPGLFIRIELHEPNPSKFVRGSITAKLWQLVPQFQQVISEYKANQQIPCLTITTPAF